MDGWMDALRGRYGERESGGSNMYIYIYRERERRWYATFLNEMAGSDYDTLPYQGHSIILLTI